MRLRNVATVLAAVALTGVAAAPASADPEPWLPYRSTDFVSPAGRNCDFDLSVADEEEYRVDARYPDGAVRVYEFRGKLVSRFTNLATGASVTRDLSGHGWEELYPDGTTMRSLTGIGPFSIGFRTGDTYPRGYYRLDGLHSVTVDAAGVRHMAVAVGDAEDICRTLG